MYQSCADSCLLFKILSLYLHSIFILFIFNVNIFLVLIVILSHHCRHPALEDIIDNVFIKDERMESESAMYRLMNDNFTNPFEDINNEYADVNVELIKKYLYEDGEVSTTTEDEDSQVKEEVKHGDNSSMQKQEKPYVPGIRKLPFYFPRRSHLDKAQQIMCLRVLLKLSSNEKTGMNETERKEFEEYMVNRYH